MRFILILFASSILIIAIVATQIKQNDLIEETKVETRTQNVAKDTLVLNTDEENVNISDSTINIYPTVSPTLAPTEEQKNDISFLDNFIYPNSVSVSRDSENIFITSSDSHEEIAEWYKNVINLQNMSARSFVTTNTNGKIINKLAGAGNDKSVEIQITKDEDINNVEIIVTVGL